MAAYIGGAAGGAVCLILGASALWYLCKAPARGKARLSFEAGQTEEVTWEVQRTGQPRRLTRPSFFRSSSSSSDTPEVRVIWHVDLSTANPTLAFGRSDLEEALHCEGPLPHFVKSSSPRVERKSRLCLPAGQSSPSGRSKRTQRFEAYTPGEGVEYYSVTNKMWTAGTISGPGYVQDDIVVYRATVGLTQQLRTLVGLDILRPPFQLGEPVSFRLHDGRWVPATITGIPLPGLVMRRYSIKTSRPIDHVPSQHVRRRFDAGAKVSVFASPCQGWLEGTVLRETTRAALPARAATGEHEVPEWPMVKVAMKTLEGLQEVEVPAYRLRREAVNAKLATLRSTAQRLQHTAPLQLAGDLQMSEMAEVADDEDDLGHEGLSFPEKSVAVSHPLHLTASSRMLTSSSYRKEVRKQDPAEP